MDKKFIISMILAVTTIWAIQFFMNKPDTRSNMVVTGQQAGGSLKIPSVEPLQKPLVYNTNFAQEKNPNQERLVTVKTNLAHVTFSTFGGVLDSIEYLDHKGKNKKPLATVYHQDGLDVKQRIKQPFLLQFEKDSPYFYELIEQTHIDDKEVVVFQTTYAGWLIRKIYELHKDSYQVDLALVFEPTSDKQEILNPRLFVAAPFVHEIEDNTLTPFVFNESGKAIEKLEAAKQQGVVWYWATTDTIIGAEDKYFVNSLVKDPAKFVQRAYFNTIDSKTMVTILEGAQVSEKASWTLSFYVGPKVYDHLAYVDERLSDILSFGWLSWLCKIILKLLDLVYSFIGNYGVAIIVVSILLRLPFVPLSIYARRKTELYQKHDPFIQRIRAKYRQDQQTMQQELMRYHQEHNISPAAPMVGCLPLVIQIPLLFSLYRILGNYLDLYQAPLFGWIVDLSAKDPYYIMPVLMGLTTLLQQQMAPASNDGKQRIVMGFFAIVMTVVFANFPAGLVLYWLMNNVLTIGEDYLRKAFFK